MVTLIFGGSSRVHSKFILPLQGMKAETVIDI